MYYGEHDANDDQPNPVPANTPMFDLLTAAMNEAQFVQVDDAVFTADHLHAPDEYTRPDDVLVEGTREDQELLLLQRDFDWAPGWPVTAKFACAMAPMIRFPAAFCRALNERRSTRVDTLAAPA